MSDFPLPVVWSHSFDWECFLWDAPLVRGDELIVRAGAKLVGLASADGTERWRVDLASADQGGEVLGAAGDVMFVDSVGADRSQQLVGVRAGGVAWRTPLGGTFVRGATGVVGGSILAVVTGSKSELLRIDPASGAAQRTSLAAGGATIAVTDTQIVILSPTARAGAPGAYVPTSSGEVERVIRTGDVWFGAVASGRVLTIGSRKRDLHVVDVRDLDTGDVRWSAECFQGTGALDDHDAAYVERKGAAGELVLRDAATGAIRWRADIGDAEPATITFAGSVVLVRHMIGLVVVRRADGHVLGEIYGSFGFGAAVADDRMFLGNDRQLICARVPG
jgi:outer membrane protein assembly factor BamB